MTYYVYSTLSSHQIYTNYQPVEEGNRDPFPKKVHSVTIKGQAGLAKGRAPEIITPRGVRTEITDDDYEALKQNPIFKIHFDNKHVSVEQIKANANKVADNELEPDVSRPRVPEDFKKGGARPEGTKSKNK